jgi:capsular polysaccharide biosynthesis protein
MNDTEKYLKRSVIIILVIGLGMIISSFLMAMIVYKDVFQKKHKGIVELSKADCIETCIRVLQTEQLFPDYHRTVQKCNDEFAEVETCRLAK